MRQAGFSDRGFHPISSCPCRAYTPHRADRPTASPLATLGPSVLGRRSCRTLERNGIEGQANTMSSPDTDKVFSGSIPKLYETYLVPLIFEPYAADLVNRLASRSLTRVLEIAAGTGVVTRALASVLPESVSIVATDLNQAMLDHASALGTKRPVEWRQADAMQLPFRDGTFDAVVCQFGVMFFPEKAESVFGGASSAQVGRRFHFQRVGSDQGKRIRGHRDDRARIAVSQGSASLPGSHTPRLLRPSTIERDLADGGFTASPRDHHGCGAQSGRHLPGSQRSRTARGHRYETRSRRATPRGSAKQPTSRQKRSPKRFGRGAVDGKIQAHIVTIES